MNPTAAGGDIAFRHCHTLAEFEACLEIEKRVWGAADIDVVPLALFVVAAETGGQVLGAFARTAQTTELVGFTLAIAGVRDAQPFLHSHMTAVLENYRDRGVGRGLKRLQREDALARGITRIEWTFDPLILKNAYFNLSRMGAIARRYLPNCYGTTTSPLHGGLPTDRLVAEWWLRSKRVEAALALPPLGQDRSLRHATTHDEASYPVGAVRVRVPVAIGEIRQRDLAEATRVQGRIREEFREWFARGYAATGFQRSASEGEYVLEPFTEDVLAGA